MDPLALFAAAMLLRGPTFGMSEIDWDESMFALMGREILHGEWPYSTIFDHKPLGLYLHFAAAIALFGDTPLATRILGALTAFASALVMRSIAFRTFGLSRPWGFLLGLCYIVATLGFGGAATYSEHLVNLYLLLAFHQLTAGRGPRAGWAGAWAGAACSVNYLALPIVFGLLAGHLLDGLRNGGESLAALIRRSGFFAAGGLLAALVILTPLAVQADLESYFSAQLAFLAGYSADSSLGSRLITFAWLGSAFLPILAAGLILIGFGLASPAEDGSREGPAGRRHLHAIVGTTLGAAVAALASGYVFAHYLLLLVPPALLWSAAAASLVNDRARSLLLGVIVGSTSLMIATPGVALAASGARQLAVEAAGHRLASDPARRLAAVARAKVGEGDTIYALCAPLALYQLLDARPPTRYPFYEHLFSPKYASALKLDAGREVERILARRPTLVLLGDFELCSGVPPAAWRSVEASINRSGYRLYARDGQYRFFVSR